MKNLLRTHTTAVSARMLYALAQQPGGFKPTRMFSIDRVFRNESLDATHLAEFHQVFPSPLPHAPRHHFSSWCITSATLITSTATDATAKHSVQTHSHAACPRSFFRWRVSLQTSASPSATYWAQSQSSSAASASLRLSSSRRTIRTPSREAVMEGGGGGEGGSRFAHKCPHRWR